MKTLVVSDIHLTGRFDQDRYILLIRLFASHDRIILNGDFWDGYRCSFGEFTDSGWNTLFPLLKSRHTIYVHGNHDRETWVDGRVYAFCDLSCTAYETEIGSVRYRFEHGDKLVRKRKPRIQTPPSTTYPLHTFTHGIQTAMLTFAGGTMYYATTRTLHRKRLTKNSEDKRRGGIVLVTGHTHDPFIDPSEHLINGGFVFGGHAHYVTIDERGHTLIHETY